MATGLFAVL